MADDEMDHGDMDGMADGTVSARMVDGVQVVEIEAGRMGYAPKQVALEAGVPARLVFTRTVDSECSSKVKIPAFGVPVTGLPMHEPVAIEFTPGEAGAFEFVCGMDMQRGSIMIRS
jgi:plastocyanin domain-containing protein